MEKKMLYDREVCSKLTDSKTRCVDCMFYGDEAKHIEFFMPNDCPWDFSSFLGGKKYDKDSLFVLKTKGCAVLTEICPECITEHVFIRRQKLVGVDNDWRVIPQPEVQRLIPNPENVLEMWCPQCKKIFLHGKVTHAVRSWMITEARFPGIVEKAKKGKIEIKL